MANAGFLAVLSVFLLITAAFALMIVNAKRAKAREFQKQIKESWGCGHPRQFLAEELKSIREYSDSLDDEADKMTSVDDITAKDTDLNRLFSIIAGGALSSPGTEVLYSYLRHPLKDEAALKERIAREDFFLEHEDDRLKVSEALLETGFLRGGSFFHYIASLKGAAPIGKGKYLLLGILTAAAIALLFFRPVAAVIALIPLLLVDYRVHVSMKEETKATIGGFRAVLHLMRGGEKLLPALSETHFAGERERIRSLLDRLAPVKRGSYLITSGGGVNTGILDGLLEYVKLFFHVDLIRFDAMLASVSSHEEDVIGLLETIGSIDAALSAASYISSMEVSARPEILTEGGESEGASILIENMGHPLLSSPVRNTIDTSKNVLLTGSNASGKSTFLKGVALSAILAQSIGIAPASRYRAPFFRILSSIALTDNLLGGESYFVVEIRSLKRIMDAAEEGGPPVLAFVDEVLRGTNTVERIAASSQILSSLTRRDTLLFAATHDIELSYLLEDSYRNLHFQESTKDADLSFDYLLKEGRAESGNAIRLLSAMGYPNEVTDRAAKMTERFLSDGEWRL